MGGKGVTSLPGGELQAELIYFSIVLHPESCRQLNPNNTTLIIVETEARRFRAAAGNFIRHFPPACPQIHTGSLISAWASSPLRAHQLCIVGPETWGREAAGARTQAHVHSSRSSGDRGTRGGPAACVTSRLQIPFQDVRAREKQVHSRTFRGNETQKGNIPPAKSLWRLRSPRRHS